jgi:hypothetical protein
MLDIVSLCCNKLSNKDCSLNFLNKLGITKESDNSSYTGK